MLGWLFGGEEGAPSTAEEAAARGVTWGGGGGGKQQPQGEHNPNAFASAGNTFAALSAGPRPGYPQFVEACGDLLERFARQRDETTCLRHLAQHTVLLEYVVHSRTWFFNRHVQLAMKQKHATVREEASAFFLLDAAADAARSHFSRHPEEVTASALKGLWILAADLSNAADPVGLRATVSQRVTAWHSLVKQHSETQRARSARGGPPPTSTPMDPRSARALNM